MDYIVKESQLTNFLKRRFSMEDLEQIVNEVKGSIEQGDSLDDALYDGIRQLIKSKKFNDIDEFGDDESYWNSYLKYEKELLAYVKSKLN
jgi:transcriptional accessory protein Tex/SPT6